MNFPNFNPFQYRRKHFEDLKLSILHTLNLQYRRKRFEDLKFQTTTGIELLFWTNNMNYYRTAMKANRLGKFDRKVSEESFEVLNKSTEFNSKSFEV